MGYVLMMSVVQISFIISGIIFLIIGTVLLIKGKKEDTPPLPPPPPPPPLEILPGPKPLTNYECGREFENYVMQRFMAKKDRFKILNQRHDQLGPDGKPLPDNSNPDLEVEAFWEQERAVIAVECKFRARWDTDNTIEWCQEHNLENYRKFSKSRNIPVFVVLGVGGNCSSPLEMFCFKITPSTSTKVKKRDMYSLNQAKFPGFFYYFKRQELQYKGAAA